VVPAEVFAAAVALQALLVRVVDPLEHARPGHVPNRPARRDAHGDRALRMLHDFADRVRLADGRRGFIYDELVTKKDLGRLWVEDSSGEVRRSPSVYSPVVASLEVGTELHPVGKRDDWYQVELEGDKAGWIHEDALDDDPPGALFVRAMSASVHAGPSPMSEVVAGLPAGTELKRLAKVGDFYHVRLEAGKTGYVFKNAVRDDEPEHVFVDVGEAEIKSDPTEYGSVKGVVPSGTELVAFDKVDDFYLVRAPDGTLGWIYDENVVRMGK